MAANRAGKRSASDILEVLAWLEANRASGWDPHFLASPRVAADAPLPRLHLEDPEAAQLDPFPALHGDPHRLEHCVDCHLGLDLGDVGNARHLVDDVDLDHAYWLLGKCKYHIYSHLRCQASP